MKKKSFSLKDWHVSFEDMNLRLNPHAVTLFLVPSRYGASLSVSYDGTASIAIGDVVYRCGAGRVDWKRVYEEFVSGTRNEDTPLTALGGEVKPMYFYWAMVLSVTGSEVMIEVRVNERMHRKRTHISMSSEHCDTDFTPTWQMKRYSVAFIH